MPVAGELVLCSSLPLSIGGCAANTAVDLARLGVSVGVAGCVGRDPFGQYVLDTLRASAVDAEAIRQVPNVDTSGTLIINVQGEDRRYIHCAGANGVMTAADIPLDRLRTAKVLYIGGYLLMPALEPTALAEVFRLARAAGVTTVLDVVLPGPGPHWDKLAPVLAHTDVFLPNADEAAEITGRSDPLAQAEFLRAAGARTVVITCGSQGTILLTDGLRLRAGIYPVDYVGGTGAGDAFDAGYIAGLLDGEDPRGCLRWGSALGASCVRAVSATESVFGREEAVHFMRENPLPIEEC